MSDIELTLSNLKLGCQRPLPSLYPVLTSSSLRHNSVVAKVDHTFFTCSTLNFKAWFKREMVISHRFSPRHHSYARSSIEKLWERATLVYQNLTDETNRIIQLLPSYLYSRYHSNYKYKLVYSSFPIYTVRLPSNSTLIFHLPLDLSTPLVVKVNRNGYPKNPTND